MELTQDDISEIQALLEGSPYAELIIETARLHISLRRTASGGWIQETQAVAQPNVISRSRIEAQSAQVNTKTGPAASDGLVNVYAPLPGTFYRAPKPGAPPFVELGASVTEDTVIGIIETMKLMNPALAKVAGTILDICTANGELVETDHILMRVRPHASSPS